MMSVKIVAVVAVLAAGSAAISFFAGKRIGIAERDAQNAELLAEYRARETELVAKQADAKEKIRIVYRDRIKVIREAAGDECLDRPVPGDIVEQLR